MARLRERVTAARGVLPPSLAPPVAAEDWLDATDVAEVRAAWPAEFRAGMLRVHARKNYRTAARAWADAQGLDERALLELYGGAWPAVPLLDPAAFHARHRIT